MPTAWDYSLLQYVDCLKPRICRDVQAPVHKSVTPWCKWRKQPPKLPLTLRESAPHLTHGSLGPPESSTRTTCRTGQPFFSAVYSPYTLQWGGTCLPKLPLPLRGSKRPPIRASLGLSESTVKNISINSSVFSGLTLVSNREEQTDDRQTDQAT